MKSATLTCHLCSSGLHTSVLHLKVDTSLSIDIYFMSVRQVYTEFCAQVHGDRDGRNRILSAFIILQKCKVQGSLLFVTYTIIQGIISSEM